MIDIRISVIIPTYNREKTIERCIYSVLAQTASVHEIIIVDDGSTDETVNIASGVGSELISIVSCEHLGAQAARNTGIKKATGNYVAFLDSDDEWCPRMVETQIKYFNEMPYRVQYTDCYLIDEYYNSKTIWKVNGESGNVYTQLLCGSGPTFGGLIAPKVLFEKIEYLDENVQAFQEWDTYIRLSRETELLHIKTPLFVYYRHKEDTISKDNRKAVLGREYIIDKHKADIEKYCGIEALSNHYKALLNYCLLANGFRFAEIFQKWMDCQKQAGNEMTELIGYLSVIQNQYNQKINGIEQTKLLEKWLYLKRRGVDLSTVLKERGYNKVAIYGMGHIGQSLYDELRTGSLEVRYGIDKSFQFINSDLRIINPNDQWEEVDAVIVTSIIHYESIKEQYMDKVKCPILSLAEIVYNATLICECTE